MPSKKTTRKTSAESQIEELRKEIDRLDNQLLTLVNRRARLVKRIGKIKARTQRAFYDQKREKRILGRLLEKNRGPFPGEALRAIFQEIISASRALETPLTIAFLGPEATFTHVAARRHFGKSAQYVPMRSLDEVFAEVEKDKAPYGVLPIENTTEGVERRTMDLFLDSPLKICAEICLDVRHNLLSRIELTQIKRVYSHPQAFAQCHSWLTENVPWSELLPCASTAKGVLEAIRDPEGAALGSELASQMYNLPVLVYSVQDAAWNQTRFVVVGKEESEPTKNDKTSVILFLKDRPGTLHRALEPFSRYKVNLCSIESRPTKKEAWKYMFYIDFEGHHAEPRVLKIFEELGKYSLYIKVLGSYPRDTGSLPT